MNSEASPKPRSTGQPCTMCKQALGFYDLNTLCTTCYTRNVVTYYQMMHRDAQERLGVVLGGGPAGGGARAEPGAQVHATQASQAALADKDNI